MANGKETCPTERRQTWGYSSAGRAPALQAGGQRFDPVYLHQQTESARKIPKWEQAKRPSGCFDRLTAKREDERDFVLTSSRKGWLPERDRARRVVAAASVRPAELGRGFEPGPELWAYSSAG